MYRLAFEDAVVKDSRTPFAIPSEVLMEAGLDFAEATELTEEKVGGITSSPLLSAQIRTQLYDTHFPNHTSAPNTKVILPLRVG